MFYNVHPYSKKEDIMILTCSIALDNQCLRGKIVKIHGHIATLLITILLLLTIALPAWGARDIKIGVIGPMRIFVGFDQWRGAMLAAEEINAKGGIQVGNTQYTIKLSQVDSNELLSISDATDAMKRAITYHKADFLIGGFRSEAVLAMQEIAMDYKKIFLGVGASHKELTNRVMRDYDRYKYFFRMAPFDDKSLGKINFMVLGYVAKVVGAQLGVKKLKVAILAEKALWTKDFVETAKQVIPAKMGMEVVGIWQPSPNATDVTAELMAIKRSGAHIIFTGLSGPVGGTYVKNWAELKIPAVSVGLNAIAQTNTFIKATEGKGNYETTLNVFGRVKISDKTIPFFDKYQQRYGEYPSYSVVTYDAIYFLAEAIKKAGNLNTDKVVSALETVSMPTTASTNFIFTKDHDVMFGKGSATGVGTQWQNGKPQVVWPVKGAIPGFKGYEGVVPYQIPPWVLKYHRK